METLSTVMDLLTTELWLSTAAILATLSLEGAPQGSVSMEGSGMG